MTAVRVFLVTFVFWQLWLPIAIFTGAVAWSQTGRLRYGILWFVLGWLFVLLGVLLFARSAAAT